MARSGTSEEAEDEEEGPTAERAQPCVLGAEHSSTWTCSRGARGGGGVGASSRRSNISSCRMARCPPHLRGVPGLVARAAGKGASCDPRREALAGAAADLDLAMRGEEIQVLVGCGEP